MARDPAHAAAKGQGLAKWAVLAVRAIPALIEGIVLLSIAVLVVYLLPMLLARALETNRRWREAVQPPSASVLTRVDFERLVAAEMIRFDRKTFMLAHDSCDGLAQTNPGRMQDVGGTSTLPDGAERDPETRKSLLSLLCDTGQGKQIREEIASWNLSFDLLAVRDNRAVNQVTERNPTARRNAAGRRLCADGEPMLPHYVQRGCFPSAWHATYVLPDGTTSATALGRAGAVPPTEGFGFLVASPTAYAGDWWLATPNESAPGEMEAGRYLLLTTLTAGSEPVVVQLIGDLATIEVEGAGTLKVDEALLGAAPRRVGPHLIEVRRLCEPEDDHEAGEERLYRDDICSSKPPSGEPLAYRIWITRAEAAARSAPLALTLSAVPIRLKPISGDGQKAFDLARTLHLNVECPAAPARCDVSWTDPGEESPAQPGAIASAVSTCPLPQGRPTDSRRAQSALQPKPKLPTVYDRNCTTALADDQGVMTDSARLAGLSDVIGLGPVAYQTLAARVAHRAPEAGAVRLTIDMDLQRRAQAALEASPACRLASPATCQAGSCRSHGMFVVVDAGDDGKAGEILASAACPGPLEGLNAWDLAVLDRSRPGASPIAGTAWRIHDVSAMPGSSFKPFTALAAISVQLQRSDPDLRSLLVGTSEAEARRLLGIARAELGGNGTCSVGPSSRTLDDTFIVRKLDETSILRCVTNVHESAVGGRSLLASGVLGPAASRCREMPGPAQIGICEALITSSNLYFAALTSRIDQASVDAQIRTARSRNPADENARIQNLALSTVVDRIFAAKHGTDENGQPTRTPFPLFARGDMTVPRLDASLVRLAVQRQPIDREGLLRRDLALNGIGQAVEATPVQMAAAYASLSMKKIVRPSVIPRAGERGSRGDQLEGQPLLDVPPGKQQEFDILYEGIRRGLKGVPAMSSGTAFRFVPRIRSDGALLNASFMKTGTATIGKVDTGAGAPSERYSAWIAGWVESLPGRPRLSRPLAFACQVSHTRAFGGATCGPIVDAFVSGLASPGTAGPTR